MEKIDRRQIVILKDMDGEATTNIIVFDYPIQIDILYDDIKNLHQRQEGWSFDDLLKLLDAFGGYTMLTLDELQTIYY